MTEKEKLIEKYIKEGRISLADGEHETKKYLAVPQNGPEDPHPDPHLVTTVYQSDDIQALDDISDADTDLYQQFCDPGSAIPIRYEIMNWPKSY